ncbi:MAG: hypothetical protein HQL31_05820 [Planctomycetes bacterium]|nr:hypothetical protein [Planctomycetota bacterium]
MLRLMIRLLLPLLLAALIYGGLRGLACLPESSLPSVLRPYAARASALPARLAGSDWIDRTLGAVGRSEWKLRLQDEIALQRALFALVLSALVTAFVLLLHGTLGFFRDLALFFPLRD